ncbi:MAG: hypothetical protein OHK0017_03370 [Patescibacteria group bacterium]
MSKENQIEAKSNELKVIQYADYYNTLVSLIGDQFDSFFYKSASSPSLHNGELSTTPESIKIQRLDELTNRFNSLRAKVINFNRLVNSQESLLKLVQDIAVVLAQFKQLVSEMYGHESGDLISSFRLKDHLAHTNASVFKLIHSIQQQLFSINSELKKNLKPLPKIEFPSEASVVDLFYTRHCRNATLSLISYNLFNISYDFERRLDPSFLMSDKDQEDRSLSHPLPFRGKIRLDKTQLAPYIKYEPSLENFPSEINPLVFYKKKQPAIYRVFKHLSKFLFDYPDLIPVFKDIDVLSNLLKFIIQNDNPESQLEYLFSNHKLVEILHDNKTFESQFGCEILAGLLSYSNLESSVNEFLETYQSSNPSENWLGMVKFKITLNKTLTECKYRQALDSSLPMVKQFNDQTMVSNQAEDSNAVKDRLDKLSTNELIEYLRQVWESYKAKPLQEEKPALNFVFEGPQLVHGTSIHNLEKILQAGGLIPTELLSWKSRKEEAPLGVDCVELSKSLDNTNMVQAIKANQALRDYVFLLRGEGNHSEGVAIVFEDDVPRVAANTSHNWPGHTITFGGISCARIKALFIDPNKANQVYELLKKFGYQIPLYSLSDSSLIS